MSFFTQNETCPVAGCGKSRSDLAPGMQFVCRNPACPLLVPKAWIFRTWFQLLVLLVLGAGLGVGSFLWKKSVDATRVPVMVGVKYQKEVIYDAPWEAYATARGYGDLTYQWYQGYRGDISRPVKEGDKEVLRIEGVQAPMQFWVRVSNRYGRADSEEASVKPRTEDERDVMRELDEMISFSRTVLEQSDSVPVIHDQLGSLVPLSDTERRQFTNMLSMAENKRDEAARQLLAKVKSLKTGADPEQINRLMQDARPLPKTVDSPESTRRRKAYSLMEEVWRKVRDGKGVTESDIIAQANRMLPL